MSDELWKLASVRLRGDSADRLADVSLSIGHGVTAIVGFSGAGKTSLLNVLAGMDTPDAGTVDGPLLQAGDARLPVYWSPQDGGLWPHLSVREHLEVVQPEDFANSADKLLADFDLAERANALPGQMSRGELSRLGVARCLAARPAVMLMDEPLAHTDPARRPAWWQAIRNAVRATECSLVFSTHEPEAAVAESTSIVCLENGTVVFKGATRDLYHQPPTLELGQFLGAVNWFDEEATAIWLNPAAELSGPVGLRPERLEIIPDEGGQFTVSSFRFFGSFAETTLNFTCDSTTHERTILTRQCEELCPLQRVRLNLK